MNKNRHEPITKVSARRRLVRGVFAAPAALSLYSGSALATSSNNCVAKEVGVGNYYPAPGSEAAAFVRVQLIRVIRTANTSKYMDLVRGDDVAALKAPQALNTYLQIGWWQCFDTNITNNDNKPFRINVGDKTTGSIPATGFTTEPGRYVALKIDVSGNIVGVVGLGGETPDQSAVHDTCWSSFRGLGL